MSSMPKFYTRSKRDEMTYGILPEYVPVGLVGNPKGDVRLYSSNEIHDLMMEMDAGFVGMRRSLIDELENVRQLILYTLAGKVVDGKVFWATYLRGKEADGRLAGKFSIGFGGHVERGDLIDHYVDSGDGMTPAIATGVPSSFYSTLNSGIREVSEEVAFIGAGERSRPMTGEEQLATLGAGVGLLNGITLITVDEFTEELTTDAMVHNDLFILRRSELDERTGTFYVKTGTVIDEVFEFITQQKPMTPEIHASLDSNVVPCGFISDVDRSKPGHAGNTHLGVLAVFKVTPEMDFKILEPKYSAIGWKSSEELLEMRADLEPWSFYTVEHIAELEKILIEQCRTEQPQPQA